MPQVKTWALTLAPWSDDERALVRAHCADLRRQKLVTFYALRGSTVAANLQLPTGSKRSSFSSTLSVPAGWSEVCWPAHGSRRRVQHQMRSGALCSRSTRRATMEASRVLAST